MDQETKSLALRKRIQQHFQTESAEQIVENSRRLVGATDPHGFGAISIEPENPILVHPSPKSVPLNAYLASALTGLDEVERSLIIHLSDVVALVCRSVDIDLYEPRKSTDPVHHADVSATEVFITDRKRVVSSDLLIHLCHFPSTGSGEELSFAYESLVPIILIAPGERSVSRMVTGIPSLKIDIRYREPEHLRAMLEERLIEIRPFLEQRKLTIDGFSQNIVGSRIRELRLEAGLSLGDLAKRVGLTEQGLQNIEENVDTISNPGLTVLRWIATALKTTVAELVDPDYAENVIAGIRSTFNERASAIAARFSGISQKDKRALLRRYLHRTLVLLDEEE
ncbi:transcriptional regulator, XRE family [Candidatus Koribacter versatilis Ellin345]|uniref:Transcriptional regulator, XRE family n=1 Tax=Koribacter versatilis (strain Ellin345) TaxID=204669 RepID=Q1ISM5_KORVE|nr:helix-turn-helix domain-containing protein [Candidatus Koribacter versatilis]ABF40125.1 transcriptional regulator, XRE family [Candidatus Koribacter versatilis Ellin345]